MSLVGLVVILVLIGMGLYVLETKIPMDRTIKTIIHAVVIIVVILGLLSVFGLIGPINSIRVPRIG